MIIETKQHKMVYTILIAVTLGGKKYLKSPGGTYEWI